MDTGGLGFFFGWWFVNFWSLGLELYLELEQELEHGFQRDLESGTYT